MSWISQNYEKAAIGAGAVIALGLAFAGWSKFSGVSETFEVQSTGNRSNNVAVEGAEKIPQAIASLGLKRSWDRATVNERPVDLFTGVPLFLKKDAPNVVIDLHTDSPVHAGIPNTWWLEHKLDPGFADSPQRDPDEDGFSNLEEFQAKTDPNDVASHPPLIAKLKFARDQSVEWLLDPGMEANPGEFSIQYFDRDHTNKQSQNRMSAVNPIKAGDLFFTSGVMEKRFKFLGSEKVNEENPRTNSLVERTYLNIEDQKPNKKGKVYRIPNNIPQGLRQDFYQYDRSAVLTLEAIGKEGQEFIVEENTRFALPPDSETKDYLLKTVTPESIEVEFTSASGQTQTITISKGAMPNLGL